MAKTTKAATTTKRTEKAMPTYHVARVDRGGYVSRYYVERFTFATIREALTFASDWMRRSNFRYGDRLYVLRFCDGDMTDMLLLL